MVFANLNLNTTLLSKCGHLFCIYFRVINISISFSINYPHFLSISLLGCWPLLLICSQPLCIKETSHLEDELHLFFFLFDLSFFSLLIFIYLTVTDLSCGRWDFVCACVACRVFSWDLEILTCSL